MKNKYRKRIDALRSAIAGKDIDGLYVSHPANVSYFTGKKGDDCALWISEHEAVILTDFRYMEMALELDWLKFEQISANRKTADFLSELGALNIGVEKDYLMLGTYLDFNEKLAGKNIVPVSGLVEKLREIKDEEEIGYIRRSEEISCDAFNYICSKIKPGISERAIATELEYYMLTHGGEGLSFDTICVSGAKSSYPHGVPGEKLIERGDFVTLDFGCVVNGYHADITRTVAVGSASEEMKKIYDIVLEAQLACCDKIKAGLKGDECHAIAADIIADAGYGEYFGHGLGHGCGLEVHESPRFSPSYKEIIPENCVMSIEPGIYLPGKFGVRIEDLCVVTADGIINLASKATKELIIL